MLDDFFVIELLLITHDLLRASNDLVLARRLDGVLVRDVLYCRPYAVNFMSLSLLRFTRSCTIIDCILQTTIGVLTLVVILSRY